MGNNTLYLSSSLLFKGRNTSQNLHRYSAYPGHHHLHAGLLKQLPAEFPSSYLCSFTIYSPLSSRSNLLESATLQQISTLRIKFKLLTLALESPRISQETVSAGQYE